MDSERYSVSTSSVNVHGETIPVLNISITGSPTMWEVVSLMRHINRTIRMLPGRYVSITDLSRMAIGPLLGKAVGLAMESSFKILVSVKHAAEFSFVILGDNNSLATSVVETLDTVNGAQGPDGEDYRYRYVYVKSADEVVPILNTRWRAGGPAAKASH